MTRRLLLVLLVVVWPALVWAQPQLRSGVKGSKTSGVITSTDVDANTRALDVSIEKSVAISIAGIVTITGALTDAELRATPVPISGTVSISGTVPVSGTFWQATQPISAASLPLPAGAATEATLATLLKPADTLTAVGSITNPVAVTGTFWQATQPVSLATAPTTPVTGTFWQTTQPVSGTFWQATQPVSGTFWQATQPVTLASTTLTSTVQPTGLTSLATGQQAVTASATALPSSAGKLVCVKVKDGGTQTIYYGPSGVTTGTGQELLPGEGMCRPSDNANRFFVIAGGTGSTVAWEVWN